MANAIGILTSALHAAHRVYDLVKAYKDAPDEYISLQKEADRVRKFLPRLNDTSKSTWIDAQSLVNDAERLTTETYSFLEKTARRKADGSFRPIKRMFVWSMWTGDAKKLAEAFVHFNQGLCAVLGVQNAYDISLNSYVRLISLVLH